MSPNVWPPAFISASTLRRRAGCRDDGLKARQEVVFFPLFLTPAAPHTARFLPFCPVWSVIQGWEPEVGCVFDPDWPFYYLSLERERRWLRMLNVYFDSVFPSTWRLFSHARHLFDGRCNIKGKGSWGSWGSCGGGWAFFKFPPDWETVRGVAESFMACTCKVWFTLEWKLASRQIKVAPLH